MALVDVVVVSFNSKGHLRECVEPLARLDDVRVIVVDNASTDGSVASIADLRATVISLPDNGGFARGCNAGWQRGEAPFVLFLNPDAVISEETLRRLVRVLEADERIGAVGPRIRRPDGSFELSQRRFPSLGSSYALALFLHRLFPRAAWSDEKIRGPSAYEQAGSPDWLSGACLLVRRGALESVGGFDDGFFLYCEDTDLCRRLREDGFEVRYEPGAIAIHAGGASSPRERVPPLLAASRLRYAQKHEPPLKARLHRVAIGLGAVTHTLVARGGLRVRAGHARAARLAARRGRTA